VRFDRFDLDAYRLFLRAKRLPESVVEYDEESATYVVSTDARFAPLLDESITAAVREELPLAEHLFDYLAERNIRRVAAGESVEGQLALADATEAAA
jgi:hypothetical protein